MRFVFLSLLLCYSLAVAAPPKPAAPVRVITPPSEVSFDFDVIPVADLLRVIYVQAMPEQSYTLDPVVLQDQRPVSFRYRPQDGQFRQVLTAFLRGLGYELGTRGKLDVIRPLPPEVKLSAVEDPAQEVFVYRPRFVDGAQLVEMVGSLFSGRFSTQRRMNIESPKTPSGSVSAPAAASPVAAPSGSLLDQANRKSPELIFVGSAREVASLRKLLAQIDVDPGQVMVTGVLYEVQTDEHQGSALELAVSALGGRFNFSMGSAQAADNFIGIKSSTVSLIMQALDSDSRFKVLSSPSVRVGSGQTASLTVGEDVPVLGAVTYPVVGGAPVQSVEYRSSGVLFNISPVVRDASITVQVDQQVSSFVNTTTGVNNSPTLTKRQLATNISLFDGDVVVIGGLRGDKESFAGSRAPFLSSLFGSKSREKSHSEILLFLQLKKV
jgi:type II secretory pathway component GspD/PulD (secretin)